MNYCIVQCLLLILRTFKFLIASYDILQKKREKKKASENNLNLILKVTLFSKNKIKFNNLLLVYNLPKHVF